MKNGTGMDDMSFTVKKIAAVLRSDMSFLLLDITYDVV